MRTRVTIILISLLVILIIVEATVAANSHPHFPWHYVPGFLAAVGFFGALVLTIGAKAMGKRGLQQPEDYDDQ